MDYPVYNILEVIILFAGLICLGLLLRMLKRDFNYYSRASIILNCTSLLLRSILYIFDLILKLLGDKNGVMDLNKLWVYIIRNVFVFTDTCFLYFAFYAIGCDWTELVLSFKMIVIDNKTEEVV